MVQGRMLGTAIATVTRLPPRFVGEGPQLREFQAFLEHASGYLTVAGKSFVASKVKDGPLGAQRPWHEAFSFIFCSNPRLTTQNSFSLCSDKILGRRPREMEPPSLFGVLQALCTSAFLPSSFDTSSLFLESFPQHGGPGQLAIPSLPPYQLLILRLLIKESPSQAGLGFVNRARARQLFCG